MTRGFNKGSVQTRTCYSLPFSEGPFLINEKRNGKYYYSYTRKTICFFHFSINAEDYRKNILKAFLKS